MNQKNFSELIKTYLIENHPEFSLNIKYFDDDSFECSHRNPTNQFAIWISTYSNEITIGVENPDGETDEHFHISCYDNLGVDIKGVLNQLTETINDIKLDKLILIHSSESGFYWTNELELEMKNKKEFEIIKLYSWNGV